MNKRFDDAVEQARHTLSEEAQEELAELVERFLGRQEVDLAALLTPEELADYDRRLASDEPDEDPSLVRAIFERHGIKADI